MLKQKYKLDDSLDVFAVHGVGGALGILLVAIVGQTGFGGTGFAEGVTALMQFKAQLIGLAVTAAWSGLISWGIFAVLKASGNLRVSEEDEFDGLDITTHGERAYDIR